MTGDAAGGAIPDRFGIWCGWCVGFLLALTPLIAWLGPLSYAPLTAFVGLVTLRVWRVTEQDRPLTIALLVIVVWACGSFVWSPYRPSNLEGATGVKLALQAPLYWAAVCAARRAAPAPRAWALRLFAWGMAILGVVMLIESITGAGIYREMRTLMHDPIRPDLAIKNVAKGGVMLAVLWVPAAVAGIRVDGSRWLALPMVAGLLSSGVVFQADAPVVAIVVSVLSGAAFWKFPRLAPKVLGVGVALFFLLTPTLMRQARAFGLFDLLQKEVETSWSERVGYWSHAIDWIGDHPLRGWGLDASRMFAPGIQLHPHDAALQVWLELGLIGAVTVGVFWAALFFRLSRRTPDLATMAGVVSAVAYMVFAAVSFGVWQEWWLALGALAAIACTLIARQPPVVQKARGEPGAVQASTIAP